MCSDVDFSFDTTVSEASGDDDAMTEGDFFPLGGGFFFEFFGVDPDDFGEAVV